MFDYMIFRVIDISRAKAFYSAPLLRWATAYSSKAATA